MGYRASGRIVLFKAFILKAVTGRSFYYSSKESRFKYQDKNNRSDMLLGVLILCVFSFVMPKDKLVSVDFEIFGNVQGESHDLKCLSSCSLGNDFMKVTLSLFCLFRCLLQDGEFHLFHQHHHDDDRFLLNFIFKQLE